MEFGAGHFNRTVLAFGWEQTSDAAGNERSTRFCGTSRREVHLLFSPNTVDVYSYLA